MAGGYDNGSGGFGSRNSKAYYWGRSWLRARMNLNIIAGNYLGSGSSKIL